MPLNSKIISHLIILGLIWLTLAIRLLYLADLNQHPTDGLLFAPLCGIDAHIYDQQGRDALPGAWPGDQPFDRSPLYPFYLILNYRLFGLNHYTPLIIQALLQAVLTAALFAIGRLTFSRWAGLGAALCLTFYDSFIFYTGCFAQEALAPSLLALTLFFLLKFQYTRRSHWLVLAGLALGLANLGRPNLVLLLPLIVIWLCWQGPTWPHRLRNSGYMVGALALTILPVTIYNYTVSGQFILISSNGPVNLFIANNPDTEGRDILAPGLVQPVHRRLEVVSATVTRGETTFTREVMRYIQEQPLDWLALELNKLWLLFGKADLNILSISFVYPTIARQIAIFATFPLHWSGLIIAALLGMLLIRPKSMLPLLFLGLITLTTLLFFVQLRFRLLLAPLVLLYAGALLGEAPALFRTNRAKFYSALFILLGSILFAPAVWPFALTLIGVGVWQRGAFRGSVLRPAKSETGFLGAVKWPLQVAWCLLVLLLLVAQVRQFIFRMGQSEDYYLGPEIRGDLWLGQQFQPDCAGLHQVQLTLGLPYERHDLPVTFHLRSLTTGQMIFSEAFTTTTLTDRTIKTFTFPLQADSQGQTYLAYLTSPESHAGNSITLRGFSDLPLDGYPDGTAIVGQGEQGQPFPGDLAFTAFCQTTLWQTVAMAFTRLPGPSWLYWGLLVGHGGWLILVLLKMRSQHAHVRRRVRHEGVPHSS